ncbi:MAG: COX15/CtaA family protein [Betaproteobacteria bacterium]
MPVPDGLDTPLSQRRRALLRRLALVAAALMLAITTLSAFIRLSNAGLGCSEWPQCYGSRLRAVQQSLEPAIPDSDAVTGARLVHRLIAVLALLPIATIVLVCFGNRPWLLREGALALAMLALAIGLAVLGRWTAGARVPAVAIANLLGGLLILALSWRLADRATERGRPMLRIWAWVGVAALLTQVALGALVSASYAGLSCAAPGDCLRATEAAGWHWEALNPWREPAFNATAMPLNPSGALAQLIHRGGALLAVLVLAPLGVAALLGQRRRDGAALLVLLALQLGLGWTIVTTGLPLGLVLAHNAAAGLLLATVVRLT